MDTSDAKLWSRKEVEAIVATYFGMLEKQLAGIPFNKAEINRQLGLVLTKRSKHSIERKHGNISAVLLELGYGYVSGYKPWDHYQNLLKAVVEERLSQHTKLEGLLSGFVQKPADQPLNLDDIMAIQVAPPKVEKSKSYVSEDRKTRSALQLRRNYLEIEARNSSLGRAGEKLILMFEHERLCKAGHRDLADRIEHVAETKGDGLGYDILSFETDGRNRLIEVKTTRFGMLTPFFISKKEVAVSESHDAEYQLFRLYEFDNKPHFFALSGSVRRTCLLDPIQFSALPG